MYKNEPIFLQPTLHERIWGGQKLKTDYGYPIPSDHTGKHGLFPPIRMVRVLLPMVN